MRTGLTVSVLLHLVLVAWGIVTLPSMRSFDPSQIEAVPVDFIPIADVTDLDKGQKTARCRRSASEGPRETAESPPPPPPAATQPPVPASKPSRRNLTSSPPPAVAEPSRSHLHHPSGGSTAAKPAAEPPPPPPKAAKVEPPKPDAPTPRPRPEHKPVRLVAEAQVQTQPEKKTDATSDDLAALIDRAEPTGSTNTTDEEATLGGRTSNPDAAMTADERRRRCAPASRAAGPCPAAPPATPSYARSSASRSTRTAAWHPSRN